MRESLKPTTTTLQEVKVYVSNSCKQDIAAGDHHASSVTTITALIINSCTITYTPETRVYVNNINGLISKKESINLIVNLLNPEIIVLTEIKLHQNSSFRFENYETRMSNLKAGKEGILIAAKRESLLSMDMIFESKNKNIATVEVCYQKDKIRIVAAHGPQETAQIQQKTEFFEELETEIQRCLLSEAKIIVAGDFNAKLEPQNSSSGNGKQLKNIIDKYNLVILNFDTKTSGKWTRIQKKGNTETKSVLDYIIVCPKMHRLVNSTIVDEDKLYTPYRVKKTEQR